MSFNQETTLCGHSIIRNIERAREYGYFVDLKYVGLDSADLAVKRVEQRVRDGGHGIPTTDVKRRYRESLHNLKKVIQLCDRVRLYDNSKSFRKIASFSKGICTDCSDEKNGWRGFHRAERGLHGGGRSSPGITNLNFFQNFFNFSLLLPLNTYERVKKWRKEGFLYEKEV